MASWGGAQLIKYLDGKLVLKGGSKEHRIAAREWISMFLNDAVVREGLNIGWLHMVSGVRNRRECELHCQNAKRQR